ncbi:hypothetical protein DMA11_10960 [Marinilabiliaceae bacterium JC017]|nr:hypothetical protein DMA11_10960 [Marinilabiliaceae bacterium JC017]
MTKRLLLLALLVNGVYVSVFAQREIILQVSPYGFNYTDYEVNWDKNTFSSKFYGAWTLEYNQYVNDWWKVGGDFVIDYARHEHRDNPAYYDGSHFYGSYSHMKTKQLFWGLGISNDFEFLRHPAFRLGSGISLAYWSENYRTEFVEGDYPDHKYDIEGIGFHIKLLGFTWGRKHGLTGQMGMGYKGILSLGYFYRF